MNEISIKIIMQYFEKQNNTHENNAICFGERFGILKTNRILH